jgi:hypothetical protein
MESVSAEKKAAAMSNALKLVATILPDMDEAEGYSSKGKGALNLTFTLRLTPIPILILTLVPTITLQDKEEKKKYGMDRVFWSRLWEMTMLAFPSYTCRPARSYNPISQTCARKL